MKTKIILIVLIVLVGTTSLLALQHYQKYTNDQAITAIVGEYSVKDEYGMRLFAHAIRNRGTLKGVYGLHAKHVKYEPKIIWQLAALAWFESARELDITYGADSWYSTDDVQKVGWPEGKVVTVFHNGTYFFTTNKPIRRKS